MQTPLIIRALKIPFPQRRHSSIVPPKKVSNNDIEPPSTSDMTPQRIREDIHRSHSRERRDILRHPLIALAHVNRDHHHTSNHTQHQENIPTHPRETEEDDRIQTDYLGQVTLLRLQDGCHPGEEALADGGRGVFLIGMFDFRGVDD